MVLHATLAHRQLYRYLFHRGKCQLLINHEYRHRRFRPLMEFNEKKVENHVDDYLTRQRSNPNILVVYLEQYRDIDNKDIETEFFEEQIKNLLTTRTKVMHLQMSWKKFAQTRTLESQSK